ncbi:squalene synthetase-like protein [Rhodotorula kratochvilovae]
MQDFDYADLVNDGLLGFTPSPAFQPPEQQPHNTGYSTPNRGARGARGGGRGAFPRGGGHTLGGGSAPSSGRASPAPYPTRGGFGGGRGRGAGLGAHLGGAEGRGGFGGRGGMRGGARGGGAYSGSSTPRSVVGMGGGGFNPLLVPVKFVRASGEGLGTVGGEDEHGLELAGAASPPPPAAKRLLRHSVEGALADEVKNLALETNEQDEQEDEHFSPPPPETAFEPEPATTATMALDELEDAPDAAEPTSHPGLGSRARHPVELEEGPARPASPPATAAPLAEADEASEDDSPPLFEISVTRSTITADLSSLPPPFALSRTHDSSTPLSSDSDSSSSSDAEQILFPRRALSHADPVSSLRAGAPPARPAAELSLPPPAPAAPRAPHPSQPAQPARQSKKALKRAARSARKLGRAHARSGNAHLARQGQGHRLGGGEEEEEDDDERAERAEDRAAGAEMFARLQGAGDAAGVEDMLSAASSGDDDAGVDAEGHVPGAPRLDDSDLEWGGDAPPPRAPRAPRGRAKKAAQRAARAQTREAEKLERLVAAGGAREEVELALALELSAKEERRSAREQERRRAEEDYAANVAAEEEEGDDSRAVLAAFARGAVGQLGGEHGRGDDADRRMAEEEEDSDEWGTSSEEDGEESDDEEDTEGAYDRREALAEEDDSEEVDSDDELEVEYSLGDADGRVEHSLSLASSESDSDADSFDSSLSSSTDSDAELFAFESALLAGQKVSLSRMGQGGTGGRKDERARRKARRTARKGKARAVEVDSDEDSSDEDEDALLFEGKDTWADRDEDYISKVQAAVRMNADLLSTAQGGRAARRSNRRERNKLFKAISEGNFDDVDLYDEALDLDDELIEAMFAEQEEEMAFGGPSKKQRKADKSFSGAFSAQLAAQWDLDRSKKASRKAQRAAERAATRDAEYRDSYRDKGQHHSRGKAGAKVLAAGDENDAAAINTRIRHFIVADLSAASLSLPPMAKKARIAVHLLAEVYGLKSRSLGSGKSRFPVLERTSRTTVVGVSERRVRAIVGTADGEHELDADWGGPRGKGKYRGKMGGLWKALEGASGKKSGGGGGGRGQLGKNPEGAVVGQGADRIGEDNVGFALLKKMGWTEGGQIGLSGQGLQEPVVARMKTGKSGLGSGFAASRSEAYALARGPE